MELTVLGTSSALPTSERYPSAHVLEVHERIFLIDCGEGTQIQLRKNKIRFSKIDNVFISHLHGDHLFGLYGLLSTFNLMGRTAPLNIYAPKRLEEILPNHLEDFGIKLSYNLEFNSLDGNEMREIYSDKHITVSAFPLEHRVPTYGFIFKERPHERLMDKESIEKYKIPFVRIPAIKKGVDFVTDDGTVIPNEEITLPAPDPVSYAYCSDTMYFSRLSVFVKDATLLYHEATFASDLVDLAVTTGHSTAQEAARTARDANVGKLLIGHFSSRYNSVDELVAEAREIFPETYPAIDGKSYPIGK